jgi:HEAT repeat protein
MLVEQLDSPKEIVRMTARSSLVNIGTPALPALIEALGSRSTMVRWQATKALGDIADDEAAPALVGQLRDRDFGVRWIAAEGLITLGRPGLPALLRALIQQPRERTLRDGAHHVAVVLAARDEGLHDLLAPLIVALERIGRTDAEIQRTSGEALRRLFEQRGRHAA